MNWAIIFSTYVNKTKTETKRLQLEQYLVKMAKKSKVDGFSLANQIGYWAGEKETSYTLTIFDINKEKAFQIAGELKKHFKQDSVIIKPIDEQVYFV